MLPRNAPPGNRRDLEGAVEDAITLTERSIRNSYSAAVYSTNPGRGMTR